MRKSAIAACVVTLLGIAQIATAADAASAQPASPALGAYAGVDAGYIGYHDNEQGVSISLSGFTFSGFVGYQFNPYIALEASYLGTTKASGNVQGLGVGIESDGFQAAVLGTLPLSPAGGIYARAGLLRWHDTVSITSFGSADNDGTNGIYGVGGYLTSGKLTWRLEGTTASISGTRVYRATLGLAYSFQ